MKNPPAFPLHNHGVQTLGMHISGMTLRDYFAAKAMQPVVDDFLASGWSFANEDLSQFIAQHCYEIADAMMKAREA